MKHDDKVVVIDGLMYIEPTEQERELAKKIRDEWYKYLQREELRKSSFH